MSLKQIAEMTGVSISTVSRVLNNRDYNCASEAVKTKIWAAAKELQYVPNESARSLRRGAEHADDIPHRKLAVILERFDSLDADPFFHELFRSVEQEAFACGCTISEVYTAAVLSGGTFPWVSESVVPGSRKPEDLQISSRPGQEKRQSIKENRQKTMPDGYILLGRSSPQTLERLKKISRNIVSVSRNPTQFEIDEIICDGKDAATRAMEYLITKGHRRIGYIGDCSYEDRYVGYCNALIRNGLPMDYASIFPTDQTTESGCEAMRKLLNRDTVEAVLCANDATAIGALQAWNEYSGGRSPDQGIPFRQKPDLISIDDIRAASEVTPALTTVHIPCEDMGKAAVKVLLDRMQRGHTETVRVEFPSRLIVRESC